MLEMDLFGRKTRPIGVPQNVLKHRNREFCVLPSIIDAPVDNPVFKPKQAAIKP